MSDTKEQLNSLKEELRAKAIKVADAQAEYLFRLAELQGGVGVPTNTQEVVEPPKPAPKPPAKPSAPQEEEPTEATKSPEEATEEFPKYSQMVKAREAKDFIREMADEGGATVGILSFLQGDGTEENPQEDRKTVLDVAETHIGEKLVQPFREPAEEPTQEEPQDTDTPEEPPAKPTPPPKPKDKPKPPKPKEKPAEKPTAPAKPKPQPKPTAATGDQRVELPEGVTRPNGAPECFGNAEVYDVDSKKCMMCIFDFECEKAQEAIANEQ